MKLSNVPSIRQLNDEQGRKNLKMRPYANVQMQLHPEANELNELNE